MIKSVFFLTCFLSFNLYGQNIEVRATPHNQLSEGCLQSPRYRNVLIEEELGGYIRINLRAFSPLNTILFYFTMDDGDGSDRCSKSMFVHTPAGFKLVIDNVEVDQTLNVPEEQGIETLINLSIFRSGSSYHVEEPIFGELSREFRTISADFSNQLSTSCDVDPTSALIHTLSFDLHNRYIMGENLVEYSGSRRNRADAELNEARIFYHLERCKK